VSTDSPLWRTCEICNRRRARAGRRQCGSCYWERRFHHAAGLAVEALENHEFRNLFRIFCLSIDNPIAWQRHSLRFARYTSFFARLEHHFYRLSDITDAALIGAFGTRELRQNLLCYRFLQSHLGLERVPSRQRGLSADLASAERIVQSGTSPAARSALADYLSYLVGKGLAARTFPAYMRAAKIYGEWVHAQGADSGSARQLFVEVNPGYRASIFAYWAYLGSNDPPSMFRTKKARKRRRSSKPLSTRRLRKAIDSLFRLAEDNTDLVIAGSAFLALVSILYKISLSEAAELSIGQIRLHGRKTAYITRSRGTIKLSQRLSILAVRILALRMELKTASLQSHISLVPGSRNATHIDRHHIGRLIASTGSRSVDMRMALDVHLQPFHSTNW
jgi:hypothetical protein